MKTRLLMFLHKRMISCDQASYLVSLRYDHRLGLRQHWQLRMHLIACHLCRKYAHQILELQSALESCRHTILSGHGSHKLPRERAGRMQLLIARGGE